MTSPPAGFLSVHSDSTAFTLQVARRVPESTPHLTGSCILTSRFSMTEGMTACGMCDPDSGCEQCFQIALRRL